MYYYSESDNGAIKFQTKNANSLANHLRFYII